MGIGKIRSFCLIELPIELTIELPIELLMLDCRLPIELVLPIACYPSRKHNPQTFSEAQPADFLGCARDHS